MVLANADAPKGSFSSMGRDVLVCKLLNTIFFPLMLVDAMIIPSTNMSYSPEIKANVPEIYHMNMLSKCS